ncbi:uncharacterized protein L969DRAFT_57516 [Mixia osmundae IAM 14324]|uniref:Leucine carboxyl methyltransferase 1 n=1 Tax=Mixia osmundae (strain CBS 9802 / IAM 14324 / JCM 22182 / KY 12970) TaxID=764103 RepID=G7E7D2_MIXOS|nr:uncharacterized protein L969DRAFT_57516 [Mixia osmundae IAM 14324]KEI42709.1 hypothetical protein L969DRAFT_57516 [Mixia osmundae IAM 14324]GAA98742.1 hypothetical protein E5Q_05430 [Mixia osmundae IAM 14324]
MQLQTEAAVRGTDEDASVSRLSAVSLGYYDDPFASMFLKPSQASRRPPLINIGTTLRTRAIDQLVGKFLDLPRVRGKGAQVVSLGAGSDTRFFRLANNLIRADQTGQASTVLPTWVEIDFVESTTRKAMTVWKRRNDLLASDAGSASITHGGSGLASTHYCLLPGDLRQWTATVTSKLSMLDTSAPTLILAECALVYLDAACTRELMQWFNKTFETLHAAIYDPLNLQDAFSRVMLSNLSARGIAMPGLAEHSDPGLLRRQLLGHGFTRSDAISLKTYRKKHLDHGEMIRLSQVERLDEIEELDLLLDHYAVAWASKAATGESLSWSSPDRD